MILKRILHILILNSFKILNKEKVRKIRWKQGKFVKYQRAETTLLEEEDKRLMNQF